MAINSLKDLYVNELQDLHSAFRQAAAVLEELQQATETEDLRLTLKKEKDGAERHRQVVARLISAHGENPREQSCEGMEGLVKEAKAHSLRDKFGDATVRDAMIVTQVQRMNHYGIAGMGSCAAMAKQLGLNDEAKQLHDCVEAVRKGDENMSEVAEEKINRAAA